MTHRDTYRGRPGPYAIAHRGGAGLAAENTHDAFGRAYALGVRYLETDVRRTADGRLVAFHDARIDRVTDSSGRVRNRTLAQLTALPVLGGGPIVEVADLFTAYPDACFTIDVKDPAIVPALADLLVIHDVAHRVCVAGSRAAWLRDLAGRVGPDLCTALSWRELAVLTSTRSRRAFGEAAFAHVPLRLGRVPVFRDDLVARAHDVGVRVLVWTVNDADTMHRLLDNGVDGIITDRPDLLREVLVARGQWHTPDSYGATVPTRWGRWAAKIIVRFGWV